MTGFQPHLEMLPAAQRRTWEALSGLPRGLTLYGGTALSLRLGHRRSYDFDFFTGRSFAPGELRRSSRLLAAAPGLVEQPDTLIVGLRGIKVSIFGGLDLGVLAEPDPSPDNGVLVASLGDLAGTKAKALVDRVESRDYRDIDALLAVGLSIEWIVAAAAAIFGPRLNPIVVLKALTSFEGDAARLPARLRRRLRDAAAGVRDLPDLRPIRRLT